MQKVSTGQGDGRRGLCRHVWMCGEQHTKPDEDQGRTGEHDEGRNRNGETTMWSGETKSQKAPGPASGQKSQCHVMSCVVQLADRRANVMQQLTTARQAHSEIVRSKTQDEEDEVLPHSYRGATRAPILSTAHPLVPTLYFA